jgi:hypothetical protein
MVTTSYGPVGVYGGYGTDAIGLINEAFGADQDPKQARAALENLTYNGVTGTYAMTPQRHAMSEKDMGFTVLTINNGQWTAA